MQANARAQQSHEGAGQPHSVASGPRAVFADSPLEVRILPVTNLAQRADLSRKARLIARNPTCASSRIAIRLAPVGQGGVLRHAPVARLRTKRRERGIHGAAHALQCAARRALCHR
eukprot:6635329-Prymnesium_polylepis.6